MTAEAVMRYACVAAPMSLLATVVRAGRSQISEIASSSIDITSSPVHLVLTAGEFGDRTH